MAAEAGYTIYELLDVMIDQIPWRTEGERTAAHQSVQRFREVNLFGQMALVIECPHSEKTQDGKCQICGRQVAPQSWRG